MRQPKNAINQSRRPKTTSTRYKNAEYDNLTTKNMQKSWILKKREKKQIPFFSGSKEKWNEDKICFTTILQDLFSHIRWLRTKIYRFEAHLAINNELKSTMELKQCFMNTNNTNQTLNWHWQKSAHTHIFRNIRKNSAASFTVRI